METSEIASMMAIPQEGLLEQLFHMLSYLKIKPNISMVFDPTEPDIYKSQFVLEDWSASSYGQCK